MQHEEEHSFIDIFSDRDSSGHGRNGTLHRGAEGEARVVHKGRVDGLSARQQRHDVVERENLRVVEGGAVEGVDGSSRRP